MDIAQLVIDYHTQERPSTSGKLYPSSLGGCIRLEIMRYRNEQARRNKQEIPYPESHPMDSATRWKLARYGWYESAFECLGGSTQVEVGNKWWSGKIDQLLDEEEPHARHILEIKSVSAKARLDKLPYTHHKYQVWCYWLLAEEFGKNTLSHWHPVKASLAYITRWYDGKEPDILVFDVTPTLKELGETRMLMEQFEDAAQQDELPGIPYSDPYEHDFNCAWRDRSGKVLSQCKYYDHCWKNWQETGSDVYLPF